MTPYSFRWHNSKKCTKTVCVCVCVCVREILPNPEGLPAGSYHSTKGSRIQQESYKVTSISESDCSRFLWGYHWCRPARQRRVASELRQRMTGVLCVMLVSGGCVILFFICNAAGIEGAGAISWYMGLCSIGRTVGSGPGFCAMFQA